MNDEQSLELYKGLLDKLRALAPWVAGQIEETVRDGRPVARQVKRAKSGAETVAVVVVPSKLRDDQFTATEELTPRERTAVALRAVERLLIDPRGIERVTLETLKRVQVDEVTFAEPILRTDNPARAPLVGQVDRPKLQELLTRLMREVVDVGPR